MSESQGTRWTIVGLASNSDPSRVKCRCECGVVRDVLLSHLVAGRTKSCGCYQAEAARARFTTHGMADVPEHAIWQAMKQRCLNPKNKRWSQYGGRGITVCDRWTDEENGFANFIEDMGRRPDPSLSIHRKDNDGGYCKDNCEWTTKEVQARATTRTRTITYDGRTMCLLDWAREKGISHQVLRYRILKGWSVEDALNSPPDVHVQRRSPEHTRMLTYAGKTQTVTAWSRERGMSLAVLRHRLNSGWSIEDALTKPVEPRKKRSNPPA